MFGVWTVTGYHDRSLNRGIGLLPLGWMKTIKDCTSLITGAEQSLFRICSADCPYRNHSCPDEIGVGDRSGRDADRRTRRLQPTSRGNRVRKTPGGRGEREGEIPISPLKKQFSGAMHAGRARRGQGREESAEARRCFAKGDKTSPGKSDPRSEFIPSTVHLTFRSEWRRRQKKARSEKTGPGNAEESANVTTYHLPFTPKVQTTPNSRRSKYWA